MQSLTISKAAQAAGVGVETVRFYERKGLIDQPRKPAEQGFRTYPDETVEHIRFIRQAQELGFSLREIQELLELRTDPRTDAADIQPRAIAKLEDVNRKLDQLGRIRDALQTLIAACPGQGALRCCSIMEALKPQGTVNPAKNTPTRRARK